MHCIVLRTRCYADAGRPGESDAPPFPRQSRPFLWLIHAMLQAPLLFPPPCLRAREPPPSSPPLSERSEAALTVRWHLEQHATVQGIHLSASEASGLQQRQLCRKITMTGEAFPVDFHITTRHHGRWAVSANAYCGISQSSIKQW